jgi:hypothetical protein
MLLRVCGRGEQRGAEGEEELLHCPFVLAMSLLMALVARLGANIQLPPANHADASQCSYFRYLACRLFVGAYYDLIAKRTVGHDTQPLPF